MARRGLEPKPGCRLWKSRLQRQSLKSGECRLGAGSASKVFAVAHASGKTCEPTRTDPLGRAFGPYRCSPKPARDW